MKKLVLASASPRRRELLELADLTFETVVSHCDENIPLTSPEEYVRNLADLKCMAAAAQVKDAVVIGADTIVYSEGNILGKPKDPEDAFHMLRSLSGKTHAVYTGVSIFFTETKQKITFYEKTDVTFYDVSEEEILSYIRTKEPMDKAGAYGIQGKGVFLVRKINGDYNNVVGLPLAHLLRVLKSTGVV